MVYTRVSHLYKNHDKYIAIVVDVAAPDTSIPRTATNKRSNTIFFKTERKHMDLDISPCKQGRKISTQQKSI